MKDDSGVQCVVGISLSLIKETVLKPGLNPEKVLECPAGRQAAPLPNPSMSQKRLWSDTAAMIRIAEREKRGIIIPPYTYFWLCMFVQSFKLCIFGPSTAITNEARSWTKPWYFWPRPAWEHPSLHSSVAWDPAKLSGKIWHFIFHVWVVQVAVTLGIGLLVDYITERQCFVCIK